MSTITTTAVSVFQERCVQTDLDHVEAICAIWDMPCERRPRSVKVNGFRIRMRGGHSGFGQFAVTCKGQDIGSFVLASQALAAIR